MTDDLTSKTLGSVKWTYLSTVVTGGLQIVVTAVLARLVAPSAFGLVAMATLVLRFGQYFAQMGVGQAVVQRADLTKRHEAAGFWASLVVGGLFAALAWAGAPAAAAAFKNAELTSVLRWMGLTFFVTGTSTVSFGLMRRAMRFKAIAITEIIAYVVGYGGAVVLALSGAGVWALVFAGLCQTAVSSVAYNFLAPVPFAPVAEWRTYRELLGFGTAVSVISFLEFMNSNLDTISVGRFAGSTSLGFYNRALSLTGLPMQYLSTSLSRVLLPSFSTIQKELERAGRAYIDLITMFAGVGLPIALGMSGAAREIVGVMLGPKWAASVPVMRIVAVASVAAMLSHFGGVLMEATAHLREKMALRAGQLVLFASLLLALGRFGLPGYATAFAISESTHLTAQTLVLLRIVSVRLRALLAAYLPGAAGGVVAAVLLYGESLAGRAASAPLGVMLVVQILTGSVVVLCAALWVRQGHLYKVARRRLGRPGPKVERLLRWSDRVVGLVPPAEVAA